MTTTEIVKPDGEVVTMDAPRPDSGVIARTPAECRVDEVSQGLMLAYQRASTLELTDDEATELMALFSDECVEIRSHDGLTFIPHIHIRRRLCEVFKPGAWSLIQRRAWKDGNMVYAEYVMVIRGCYVGEAVGAHEYVPSNKKMNYSDSLESTASEALRRIAAKALSCGDQCWDPAYSRRWMAEHAFKGQDGKWHRKKDSFGKAATKQPKRQEPEPEAEPEIPDKITKALEEWKVIMDGDPSIQVINVELRPRIASIADDEIRVMVKRFFSDRLQRAGYVLKDGQWTLPPKESEQAPKNDEHGEIPW